MARGYKCYNCGRGIMVGHNVSHAKNRLPRVFRPNLHAARIVVDGRVMRVRLCTKCLRELRGRSARQLKAKSVRQAQDKSLKLKASEVSSIAPVAAGLV